MAYPILEFAALSFDSANGLYSNENQVNGFIRIKADYVSGSPNVTNISAVAGYFGIDEIRPGMIIVSSGEISGESTIVSVDTGNNSLVMADNAIASATDQTTRIRPQKGFYFIESASFSKNGTGEPSDLRDVTGSNDSEYDNAFNKWGVILPLAKTGSVTTTVTGLYGQYQITEFQSRINASEANIFISSSNDLGGSFTEDSGSQVSAGSGNAILAEISNTNGLMPIMGATDVGAGSQGLALAAYNASVEATFALLSSGSGFPFTGSAEITGSLTVTGSSEFIIPVGGVNDNFIIASGSGASQERVLNVTSEGVVQFFAQDNSYTPTAVLGGIYFTSASAFIGVE